MPPNSASRAAGACLCGEVEFRVQLPAAACVHCHCTLCQRNHGAAYVTWFVVPKTNLTIEQGEESLATYASSNHGVRKFCKRCGSSLFCELQERENEIDIVLANMKDSIELAPQLHIFYDDRATWTHADDHLPKLGGKTGMEPIND